MPEVFATGFLVGFLEWTCVKAINPHLDVRRFPREPFRGAIVPFTGSDERSAFARRCCSPR
jgi:hypothetical protein